MAGETEGFVKIVADKKYDEILGVHMIGPRSTELVAEAVLALRLECTVEELVKTIHAHPTFSEAIGEAAHATHRRADSLVGALNFLKPEAGSQEPENADARRDAPDGGVDCGRDDRPLDQESRRERRA
jgi:hypothetical protein